MAAPSVAAIPGDCTELGIAITEHSCFHAVLGPFDSVRATGGTEVSGATPTINAVHTEYRIGLAGEYSVVTYTPELTGAYAVFLGKDVPLEVLAGPADARPSIFDENGTTDCDALPILHVFELTKGVEHRFVFGPTAEQTVVAVVEYVDAFQTTNGRDADGDGAGSRDEVIVSPCEPPEGFAPNASDCNDADPMIHPGAEELCGDAVDQNCNGSEDDMGLPCRVGAGACVAVGRTVCADAGATAICAATSPEPSGETCNGIDDDCNGRIDDDAVLCADPERPTCVRTGSAAECGCRLDLDCGDVTSGRVCNTATGTCEDGCSPLPGGNGCGSGEVCDVRTASCKPDTGVGGGASGSGSGGVSGGVPSASGGVANEGGEAGAPASEGGDPKEDGCGCRVVGQRSQNGALGFLGLALAASYLRRRRLRRAGVYFAAATVAASSLLSCGGRATDSGADDPIATGGSTAAGSGNSGATVSGAGGAVQAPACVPELGKKLVEHACSHTTKGPFVPVVAGGDDPPDVSDLHHTFEVEIPGSEGSVLYRAQREGHHAFMTDVAAVIEVRREGKPLSAHPRFPVGGCSTLENATVYDLQRDAEYVVYLRQSPRSLKLFVEHLAAFGSKAWIEPCDEAPEL